MDDMQSRIAARRAEIERQRAASGKEESVASNDGIDDILHSVFGGADSTRASGTPAGPSEPKAGGRAAWSGTRVEEDLQHRLAARRAAVDSERRRNEAAAKAAEAAE
jgi:hypothetical protein